MKCSNCFNIVTRCLFALSSRHLDVTFGGDLQNSKCSILKTNDATELKTCKKVYFYKLLLHSYISMSISSHEGTCRCNISLGQLPASFSCVCKCCDFVPATCPRYSSLLHVASVCTTQVFCPCNMSLRHVPET